MTHLGELSQPKGLSVKILRCVRNERTPPVILRTNGTKDLFGKIFHFVQNNRGVMFGMTEA